jgi:hypothetical protein
MNEEEEEELPPLIRIKDEEEEIYLSSPLIKFVEPLSMGPSTTT